MVGGEQLSSRPIALRIDEGRSLACHPFGMRPSVEVTLQYHAELMVRDSSFQAPTSQICVTDFSLSPQPDGLLRLQCRVVSEGFPEHLWFEANAAAADMVALDEPNWAAVALLYPAMLLGRDLVIEAGLSPRLLHALQGDLQALLLAYDSRLRRVHVKAGVTALPAAIPRNGGVATGFSAGVDSFSTLILYSGPEVPEPLRITHLTVNDLWAFGSMQDEGAVFRAATDRCANHAEAKGLEALFTRSNLNEIFRAPVLPRTIFQNTHTLRNGATALLFQNGIDYFLYSSTYPYDAISATAHGPQLDTANLDPMLLPLLSTERLTLISSGAGLSRAEKTALLADDPDARQLLDVCVSNDANLRTIERPNCSRCGKCIRTMVTLDALGKLDAFAAVFDLPLYWQKRPDFLRRLQTKARAGSSLDAEVLALAAANGIVVPRRGIGARIRGRLRRAGLV